MTRLRFLASVNPATPEFETLDDAAEVTFVPLEDVWPPPRWAPTRRRVKAEVSTGYTRFREGDVLVPKITPTFEAGRSVIAKGIPTQVAAGTTELHTVRPRQVESRYLNYCLQSRPFLHGGEAAMVGVAGQKRVPEAWVLDYDVAIDDYSRQSKIADVLDAETARIDALVAKKRRLVDRLELRRQTVVAVGVCGGFSDAPRRRSVLPWFATTPCHWTEPKLTYVARLGSGHTPSRDRPEWWEDCNIPWVTTGEVVQMRSDRIEFLTHTREMISELGLANSAAELHPEETVVLCRTAASAGYSAILALPMATSQDFATWTCGPQLRPRFLLLCLRAMRRDLLERLAIGSTHRTIYMPDIESLKIPLPPLDEQDEIVENVWRRLRLIDQTIETLDRQIDLLREKRQAIITAAVTGQEPARP